MSYAESYVIPGKLALPYQYFAGKLGSAFLIGLRQGKLLGWRDRASGKVYLPPRSHDEATMQPIDGEWVTLPGTGKVTNFTMVSAPQAHHTRPTPFILAVIQIDGADTPLTHFVAGSSEADVQIGMTVRAQFRDAAQREASLLDIECFVRA